MDKNAHLPFCCCIDCDIARAREQLDKLEREKFKQLTQNRNAAPRICPVCSFMICRCRQWNA